MSGPHVTELRAGDEVVIALGGHQGVTISGPLRMDSSGCCLAVGPMTVVTAGKSVLSQDDRLTVTKLAPRPLYINHDRTEPVDGDVVRDADSGSRQTWVRASSWATIQYGDFQPSGVLPKRLVLLVDGDTGRAMKDPTDDSPPVPAEMRTESMRHPLDMD